MAAKEANLLRYTRRTFTGEGGEELLDYLSNKSDFFTAPAPPLVPRLLPRRAV